jgi:3-methyladenine DNA glycosylase AlkD
MLTRDQILTRLQEQSNPEVLQGMARFGVNPTHALGINIPVLRKLARETGKNHALAAELWKTGIHEARILASMIDEPHHVSPQQMEEWVNDFDSWDVCDQVCGNLFDKTPYAYEKSREWCHREQEFVRRAGFVMMASLAVHDKKATDEAFLPFFPLIQQYATDERNFVKKGVNWALRQMGKRNSYLRTIAIQQAEAIAQLDSKAAHWIARDALKELSQHQVGGRRKTR